MKSSAPFVTLLQFCPNPATPATTTRRRISSPGTARTQKRWQALTYPENVQIALARGWLAPVNGNFLPEQPLTATEAETVLQDARQVLEKTTVGIGTENSYTFADGVIEIPA